MTEPADTPGEFFILIRGTHVGVREDVRGPNDLPVMEMRFSIDHDGIHPLDAAQVLHQAGSELQAHEKNFSCPELEES